MFLLITHNLHKHRDIFLSAQVRFDNEFVELSLTLSFIKYALNFISLLSLDRSKFLRGELAK